MNRFTRCNLRTASAPVLLLVLLPAWSKNETRQVETANAANPVPNSIDGVVKNLPECNAPRVGDKSRENIYATGHFDFLTPFFSKSTLVV
jgi:hypothetical protein